MLDPAVLALFDRVIGVSEQNTRYFQGRAAADSEQRFKIKRDIPKISADSGRLLLDEFDEFEEVFSKTDPRSAKEWALTLDEALTGTAKRGRDFEILMDPGRGLYERITSAITASFEPSCSSTRALTRRTLGILVERSGETSSGRTA